VESAIWASVLTGAVAVISAVFAGVTAFRKQRHEQRTADTAAAVTALQGTVSEYKAILEAEAKERKEETARWEGQVKGLQDGLRVCHEKYTAALIEAAGLKAQVQLLEQSVRALQAAGQTPKPDAPAAAAPGVSAAAGQLAEAARKEAREAKEP